MGRISSKEGKVSEKEAYLEISGNGLAPTVDVPLVTPEACSGLEWLLAPAAGKKRDPTGTDSCPLLMTRFSTMLAPAA